MSQEAEQSEEFSTLKEEIDRIITDCWKSLKEQVKKLIKLEIEIQEQELQDNFIEAIKLITGGFVINANRTTNTDTVFSALMDSYHERLLKYTHMNQYQFKESYKAKHMLTTFPPAPPVVYTFVQAARIAAQRQAKKDQRDSKYSNTFGTQEDSNQPQWVTFN